MLRIKPPSPPKKSTEFSRRPKLSSLLMRLDKPMRPTMIQQLLRKRPTSYRLLPRKSQLKKMIQQNLKKKLTRYKLKLKLRPRRQRRRPRRQRRRLRRSRRMLPRRRSLLKSVIPTKMIPLLQLRERKPKSSKSLKNIARTLRRI